MESGNFQFKILIVEDDEGISRLIQKSLLREGFKTEGFSNGEDALLRIEKGDNTILLLDYFLPDMDGEQFVQNMQEKNLNTHFIIMTGYGDERIAVQMMKAGARDYLVKDKGFIEMLPQVLKKTIRILEQENKLFQIENELKEANEKLEERVAERTNQLTDANKNLEQEIKERKQIEERLVIMKNKAEASNRAKSEFLANMSHELRTPMHHILSYSKYGIDKISWAKQEKLLHYFTQINTSGGRLLSLINDLLDLSKLESGRITYEMHKTDLTLMVERLIFEFSPASKENSIQFQMTKTDLSTVIFCDSTKIEQVLRNLISNAIKFTNAGKTITISFDHNEQPAADGLTVRIMDEGMGIPENELESVFEKFIQSSRTKTNAGGTGLGLSICKEIINAHNGKIWAENNSQKGSTFCVTLPYHQD